MRPSDFATRLHVACTAIVQQQELARTVARDSEQIRAELRELLDGLANPLVKRVLGNHA